MIGNDIIDLQLARKESNWQRPRFLEKIFTQEEQDFIHHSPDKEMTVWWLWSGKESVYKIISRLEKRRFFAPKKIIFRTDDFSRRGNLTAKVVSTGRTFSVQSVVTDTHIHTIAQLNNNDNSPITNHFHIKKNNYPTQHQTTRQYLLKNYAEITNLAVENLTIQKDEWNIPHLYHQNKKQSTVISISHHGNYGGYAILRDEKTINTSS